MLGEKRAGDMTAVADTKVACTKDVVTDTATASTMKVAPTSEATLLVKLLSSNARAPVRGSAKAAGLDIFAAEDATVPAGGRSCIKTDIALAVPPGHYARVAPRSGLALKHGIDVGAGVVDEDYRGPLGVVLFNLDRERDFAVRAGDRVAQLVLERISAARVDVVDDLDATDRGAGGFGSTGGFSAAN